MNGFIPTMFGLTLALAAWALDSWLFLIALRLSLGWIGAVRTATAYSSIQDLTDPLRDLAERGLSAKTGRIAPSWILWPMVVLALVLARQILTAAAALTV